jgi:flagellar hook assembly protein FlgD
MPGWGDALDAAREKEKQEAIKEQLEQWQKERNRDDSVGKYGETEEDDLSTSEGRSKFLSKKQREIEDATNQAKAHADNTRNNFRNEWEARSARWDVRHIDGVKYYSKGDKTFDEDGRDRSDEM